jgi:TonB-dependent receptor
MMAQRLGRTAVRRTSSHALGLLFATTSFAALAGAACADTADSTNQKSVGEVVITAPREEVKARAVQQAAPNIVRVQAAETILKYPDFNAAEALSRMPDISLSSDTGEGRFVQIRGIDANLNGATYGGVPLLNTNPGGTAAGGGGRAVEFDTIPQGAIDGIIVTLTGQPDHEAEGLGGTIELSPRSAARIDQPFVDFTLGGGYEPLHAHGGPFNADLAVGGRFGFGDKGFFLGNGDDQAPRAGFISNPAPFSFVLTASYRDDRRAVDDLEESYLDDGSPSTAVGQYDLRRYDYHRRRFGYGGEFDFEPNEDHTWYVRADVAGYVESVHKNFLLFTKMDDPTVNPALPSQFITTTTPQITLTDEQETHRNQVYVVGGKDRFGDWIIDYHLAYSQATFHVDRNIGAKFSGPGGTPITYDNATTPNFPIFGFPGGFNVNNASAYTLSSLKNDTDFNDDHEWSFAGNAQVPVHLWGGDDAVKFGFQVRLRDKDGSEFDNNGIGFPPLSLAAVSFAPITYYDGHYSNGPQINVPAIEAMFKNGGFTLNGLTFNPDSFFTAQENIYAGYAMYTGQWGKFGLMGGVRVEATDARYGAFIASTDPAGDTTETLTNRPESYVNAFPTVQLRYNFTQQMQLRFTYSTGIARPGFNQNTAASSVDFTASPVLISRGNPNLKPTLGQNFDLSWEYYLPDGGILQFGAFDKEFTNYIATTIQNTSSDPLSAGLPAQVSSFINIPSAYARGVDADYNEKFTWLAKPFDGLGIDANVTFVDSHMIEYDAFTVAQNLQNILGLDPADPRVINAKAQTGLLPGTSPITWNVAGFYEAYGWEIRLAAQYVEHSLFGLGGLKQLDTIQDNRTTLDFTSAYHVNQHWTLYFNAKNLLNTPLRYYEGTSNRPIQREFYEATYEAGVRAHF